MSHKTKKVKGKINLFTCLKFIFSLKDKLKNTIDMLSKYFFSKIGQLVLN